MNEQAILTFALLGGLLLIFALTVMAFFVRRTLIATIEGFSWYRKVFLEHYIWVLGTSSSGFPAGSRNQHREVEHYQSYEHIRDETTTTSVNGQTTTTTQPVYGFVTRERTKYTYEIQQWVKSRELLAEGTARATLHWPAYVLDGSTQERVESTQEKYVVCFQTARGKKYKRELPETDWATLDDTSTYLLKVNAFGHIMNFTPSPSQIASASRQTS